MIAVKVRIIIISFVFAAKIVVGGRDSKAGDIEIVKNKVNRQEI